MSARARRLLLLLGIALAAVLRFNDLTLPDLATDEAQFALGWSAAHPPLGMWLLRLAQWIAGPHLWVVRAGPVLAGVLTVVVLFFLARAEHRKDAAMLTLFLAAVWPSHVLFSRLAFLTVFQCLAWLVLLLCFVHARRERSVPWLLAVYAATLAAVFIKAQGFLLPGFLLLGLLIERRQRIVRDPLAWAVLLGVLPVILYIASHPGVPATVLFYAGSKFDIYHIGPRLLELLATWRSTLGIAILALPYGAWQLRRLSWPVAAMAFLAVIQGLYLDPGSAYYSAQLVVFSLPVAVGLMSVGPPVRIVVWVLIAAVTLAMYGPYPHLVTRWTHPLYREEGYWNAHADQINAVLSEEPVIGVVGSTGHQLRWYLAPRLLVGEQETGVTLYVHQKPTEGGEVLYDDGVVVIVRK